jgi:FkbM family methyltransferase
MLNYADMRFLVRCLRYRYRTERLPIRTLMGLNLSGATVLDIGANKGIYSFWMARAVGEAGRVLAFEPQPEMRIYIESRKANFGWRNVTVFETALSNAPGMAVLARQRIGDGSASLQPSRRRDSSETITVALTKLDDMQNLASPRFIKCDVEGHEHQVFLGAEETIRKHRPVVQFEAIAAEVPDLFSSFSTSAIPGSCCWVTGTCLTRTPTRSLITNSARAATATTCSFIRKPWAPRSPFRYRDNSRELRRSA